MSVVRWIVVALLFLTAGCGEGYRTPTAILWLEFATVSDMETGAGAIELAFVERGFRATHADMAFLRRAGLDKNHEQAARVDFWQHRETSLFLDRDISLSLTPYPVAGLGYCGNSDCDRDKPRQGYPFIEITVSDGRPGGFSADGIAVYGEILSLLQRQGGKLVVAIDPPPADEAEHDRIVTNNAVTRIVWWLVAWALYAVVIGWTSVGILRVCGVQARTRGIVFVVLGVACITPLPISTGFFSFYIPAVLWLPSSVGLYAEYAEMFGLLLPAAFLMSLGLSLLVALLFVRDRHPVEPPGQPADQ